MALRRGRDRVHVGHPQHRFDDSLEADAAGAAGGRLDLGNQDVDGVDVGRMADLRNPDQFEAPAGRLEQVDDVPVPVRGVRPVDAHRNGAPAPVDVVEGGEDVVPGPLLVIRSHGASRVREDEVRSGPRRLFEGFRPTSGNGPFAAVQTGRRPPGDPKAHREPSAGGPGLRPAGRPATGFRTSG